MHHTTWVLRDEPRPVLEDIAIGPAWLREQVTTGERRSVLRLYRPAPTLAFSGRDCLSPGVSRAATIAREHGFEPVRRGPGGHATAYHGGCLGIDQLGHEALEPDSITARFRRFGALIVHVLSTLGVRDAAMGEVPGEYCPGEYSVHDGRGHKLVGTAQRLSGGAWLFSTMIVVSDPAPIAAVLDPVYRALDLPFDPATVGAVDAVAHDVSVDALAGALTEALAGPHRTAGEVPAAVVERAIQNRSNHLLPGEN